MPDPQSLMASHEALVAQLCRPGALAGAAGAVSRLDTHLSTLLLAGDRVYKLKKPVRFDFVDFSTLALRHEACAQELRLNRRTAPRLYLAVLPVLGCPGGAVIDPDAPPDDPTPVLDWAVQMRRFDESQRFDRLARAGQLGAAQIDALADAVGRFHHHQAPAPPGFGSAQALRHWAGRNLDELAGLLGADAAAWGLPALQAWSDRRGQDLVPLMALRSRTGHVRELHGDLHLANIVWSDGAPLIFDALEFNDTLRHTDTIGDLAFPFMDLLAHGLPRLAWRFINQVLETAGDQAALPLLRWWAAYRAAVRAKVALLSGGPQARREARRYLDLAHALAAAPTPAQPLRLLLCMGLSGSGKTTVAGLLAERIGAVRLRSDVERKRLHGLAPQARAAATVDLYSAEANARTYERLGELAEQALAGGVSVVIDAAALRRTERDALQALARRQHAAFGLLLCQAPPAVLRARVVARLADGGDASDATPEVLAQQQQRVQWPGSDEAAHTRLLSTDLPLAELAAACESLALPGG